MLADGLPDELGGVAADLRHRALAFEREALVAADFEPDHRLANVVERIPAVEHADERADGAARVVILGLAEQQRAAALDVTQVHVVAERRAENAPGTIYRDHDLGLGIVPGGLGTDAQ